MDGGWVWHQRRAIGTQFTDSSMLASTFTHTHNTSMNVIRLVYIVNSFGSLLLPSGLVREEMWTINQV